MCSLTVIIPTAFVPSPCGFSPQAMRAAFSRGLTDAEVGLLTALQTLDLGQNMFKVQTNLNLGVLQGICIDGDQLADHLVRV